MWAKMKIVTKISLNVFLPALLVLLSLMVFNHYRSDQLSNMLSEHELHALSKSFQTSLENEAQGLKTVASLLNERIDIQRAFESDAENDLVEKSNQLTGELSQFYHIDAVNLSKAIVSKGKEEDHASSHKNTDSGHGLSIQDGQLKSEASGNLSIEGRAIGSVTLTAPINFSMLEHFKEAYDADVVLMLGTNIQSSSIVAATIDEADQKSLMEALIVSAKTGLNRFNLSVNGKPSESLSTPLKDKDGKTIGFVSVILDKSSAATIQSENMTLSIIFGVVILSLVVISTYYFTKRLTSPVLSISDALTKLTNNETDFITPGLNRNDEFASIAFALDKLKGTLKERNVLQKEKEQHQRAQEEERVEMEKAIQTFENDISEISKDIVQLVNVLETSSSTMSGAAEETNRLSSSVASAALQAEANVKEISENSEVLVDTISGIGKQIGNTSSISQQAVSDAKNATNKIAQLEAAADEIGTVVNLINDIAAQTNLLALNATIEAARAGNAGKGFAVVASEVKNLANQTARATEEIVTQISGIQGEAAGAVSAINQISDTIQNIYTLASEVQDHVEDQGQATASIASNSNQASETSSEVSENIEQVASSAKSTGDAADHVQGVAEKLQGRSDQLSQSVSVFLKRVTRDT